MISGINPRDHKRLLQRYEQAIARLGMKNLHRKELEKCMHELLAAYKRCDKQLARLDKAVQEYKDLYAELRTDVATVIRHTR